MNEPKQIATKTTALAMNQTQGFQVTIKVQECPS